MDAATREFSTTERLKPAAASGPNVWLEFALRRARSLAETRSASAKPRSSAEKNKEKKRAPELKEAGAQRPVFTGNLL